MDYSDRIAAEQRLFNENTKVHDLPAIYYYWSDKWVLPKLRAFRIEGAPEMFEECLTGHCQRPGTHQRRFVSIGAGNCELEVDLAQRLRKKGYANFLIECRELNPAMLARGRAMAEQAGVDANLAFVEADVNQWRAERAYDAALASQSLHHVQNLEGLFEQVRCALRPGGQFVVSDMIGRNGHMRWPEALPIVEQFWEELPPSYRYNQALKRQEEFFDNWDCSSAGFEGIRAQDILPLLLRSFHFELFIAFGNVIVPFVDRAFGHNFNAAGQWDREFIDHVHRRDEQEMLAGRIKPTIMVAILGTDATVPTQYLAPFSPDFCVRSPEGDRREIAASNPWIENREWKRRMEEIDVRSQQEISQLSVRLETAQGQIEQAAKSRWVRLGRRLGLGPKLRLP